ncbi:DNA cytosine methyltransferase [Verrucomicrobiota bacterium]
MPKSEYNAVTLFCGIGGLDLGLELGGFNVSWASDISENAAMSYAANFNIEPKVADLQKLPLNSIPDADLIVGGPPCQSFSLVGKRASDDERGKLVFRFIDVIKKKKPRAFIMENVPGIAASRIGNVRLPNYIASEFKKKGYHVTVAKLMASDYLVPQRRARIFIMGSRDVEIQIPNPHLFSRECYGVDVNNFDISASGAIGDLGPCTNKGEMATYKCDPHTAFVHIMRQGNAKTVSLHEKPRMSDRDSEFVKHIPPGGNYRDIPEALDTERIAKFKKSGGRTTTYGRLHPDQPSYTINTYFRRPNVGCNFHYAEPRLITPREAMRFQCLPDRFKITSNSQDERNAYIGNAVPSILGHAIAWTVRNALEGRMIHSQEDA